MPHGIEGPRREKENLKEVFRAFREKMKSDVLGDDDLTDPTKEAVLESLELAREEDFMSDTLDYSKRMEGKSSEYKVRQWLVYKIANEVVPRLASRLIASKNITVADPEQANKLLSFLRREVRMRDQ